MEGTFEVRQKKPSNGTSTRHGPHLENQPYDIAREKILRFRGEWADPELSSTPAIQS